jgi:hypothetical protein
VGGPRLSVPASTSAPVCFVLSYRCVRGWGEAGARGGGQGAVKKGHNSARAGGSDVELKPQSAGSSAGVLLLGEQQARRVDG